MAKAVRSKAVSSTSGTGKAPAPEKEAASTTKAPAPGKAPAKAATPPSKKVPHAAAQKSAVAIPKAPKTTAVSKAATVPAAPALKAKSATKKAAAGKSVAAKKTVAAPKTTTVAPAKPTAKTAVKKPVVKAEPVKTAAKATPKVASKKVASAKSAPAKPAPKKATPKKITATKAAPKKATAKKPVSKAEKVPEVAPVLPKKDLGKAMEPYRARRVLITLPQPEGDKSPYFDFAKKQDLTIDFFPFISVEGLTGKEFRQQKIDLNDFTAVVFTSRLAVEHFFRIMEEVRVKVNQDLKYFCITEAVALYLQKFIMYRKRKVFFSADGSTQGLLDVIGKHKQERYMVSTADGVKKELPIFLKKYKIVFAEAALYRTVSNNISPAMAETRYDMILFFSPYSVQALFEQAPGYQQRDTVVGAFGPSTAKAVEDAGLRLDIKAPAPQMPSMVAALEHFFEGK